MNTKLYSVLLICLLLLSLVNNLYGIAHGLPFVYDPDEPTFVTTAGAILSSRDLNPHWFGHPGTTTIYMLAGLYGGIYAVGRLFGVFLSPDDFRLAYHDDPTLTYLSGRLLNVVFSVLVVFLTAQIGTRVFNRKIGLVGGLLLALSPLYVQLSKLIRTDIQATFWLLLSCWFCLNIIEKKRWRDYLLAGFFLGLGIATKYPIVLFAFLIAMAFVMAEGWSFARVSRLIASAAASLAGAFSGSPFLFLDFQSALQDVLREARPVHLGATGEGFFANAVWYIQGALPEAMSWPGLLLSLAGIAWVIHSRKKTSVILVIFSVIFLLFVSSLTLRWERWVIPMLPFLFLLLAYALENISQRLESFFNRPRLTMGVMWAGIALIGLPMAHADILLGASLSSPHTRTQAAEWMLQNIPEGSRVLMEVYGPILPKEQYLFYYVDGNGELALFNPQDSYKNNYKASGNIGNVQKVGQLAEMQIEYIVLSQMYSRYKVEELRYPLVVAHYEQVIAMSDLIHQIKPQTGFSAGPPVYIYKLRQE